jgi:uncharacterized membrane protein YidH (DUF202 family)
MAHDQPKTGADGAPLSVVPSEHDLEKQKEKAEKEARDFAKEQMIVSALGMTLYKVFEAEVGPGGGLVLGFLTAREIGLFMLLVGFVSLVFATQQHVKAHNKIKIEYEKYAKMPSSLSLYLTYAILFIALFLFLATLSRYGSGMFTTTK